MNRSGVKIDAFWVHPQTRQLADSNTEGGIVHGADAPISSYIGHTFEVQELPKLKTGKCEQEECRRTRFTVSSNEGQGTCLLCVQTQLWKYPSRFFEETDEFHQCGDAKHTSQRSFLLLVH